MTLLKYVMRIVVFFLLLLLTLLPVTASSQTDSLICLPIAVIDSTIIELQELDYLREKTVVDQEMIENLQLQVNALDSANRISREIILQENGKADAWRREAEHQERLKNGWKWFLILFGIADLVSRVFW